MALVVPSRARPSVFERTHGYPPRTIQRVLRLSMLGWEVPMISTETSVSESTIWRWQARILKTGSMASIALVPMGRPRSLTQADEQAMLEWMMLEALKYPNCRVGPSHCIAV